MAHYSDSVLYREPIKSYVGVVAFHTMYVPTTLSGYDHRLATLGVSHSAPSYVKLPSIT